MQTLQQVYLSQKVPAMLSQLQEDAKPLWGIMGPQHMVEHVSALVYLSLGKHNLAPFIPEEKIPRAQEWLMSDKPFRQNIKVPMVPENETAPLRFANLEEAKARLLKTLEAFFQRYEQDPEATAVHPAFGALDKAQWEQFHYKHIRHHFSQFGLE